MSTLLLAIVGALMLVGGLLVGALFLGHLGEVWRLRRGVPVDVWCPRHGQKVMVRVGTDPKPRHLQVLSCECQPGGVMHCGAECFPSLTALTHAKAPTTF